MTPTLSIQLHAAQAFSEFQGYTGDCVLDAMLMGLHAQWPARFALTASVLDAMVADAIAHYGAGPRGQWDYGSMTRYLTDRGYRVRNMAVSNFPAELKRYAGVLPCVVGVTNAAALPGNEPGVQNHAIALFGLYSDGTYSCGNGDATRSDPNTIQRYSDTDLANAHISSISWIEGPMLQATDPDFPTFFSVVTLGDGTAAWKCKQTGQVIAHGMLNYYQYAPSIAGNGGLGVLGLPLTGEYAAGPASQGVQPVYQSFELGRLLYDPHHTVDTRPGAGWGPVFPAKLPAPTPPTIDKAGIQADLRNAQIAIADAVQKVG